mmetsp:Transcript_17729/g.55068  ORF Transcript_17729/g.55068 Transcript_17729/m.55068 type:complete len:224 (-) Transcript_17729:613-1284(-)
MVVVRLDGAAVDALRRMDNAVIIVLLEARAQLGALVADGHHALRLLDAPAAHVADGGGALGEECRHRQRHGRVGDFNAIHIHALELSALRRACDCDAAGCVLDLGAHFVQAVGVKGVALQRVRAAARHGHGAACDGRARQKVRRTRRVALHQHLARRDILLLPRHHEAIHAGRVPLDLDAEALHELDRHLHVRRGDKLIRDADGHTLGVLAQRRGHEQRREVL